MKKRIALVDSGEVLFKAAAGSEIRRWHVIPKEGDIKDPIMVFKHANEAKAWCFDFGGEHLSTHEWEDFYLELFKTPISQGMAVENLESILTSIKENTKVDKLLMCFGDVDGNNFRDKIATIQKYKDRPKDKPYHYTFLQDYIRNKYLWMTHCNLEDDDTLAIIHNNFIKQDKYIPIICSSDKDLNQVPGFHYNIGRGELYEVSKAQALRNFYTQLYTGDATDTIPGYYEITGKRKSTKNIAYLDNIDNEYGMYLYVRYLYQVGLRAKNTNDLDCILWEIANLLYLRRSTSDNWVPPVWR